MESFPRLAQRVLSVPFTPKFLKSCKKTSPLTFHSMQLHDSRRPISVQCNLQGRPSVCTDSVSMKNYSSVTARAGWFLGLGENKKQALPDIVKAGDPVLHEPTQDVPPGEIGSEWIRKIIDEMVRVMRNAPGVGLAAPQIGIPLKIIVLEDTNEYISYAPKDETKAQDRRSFDLLVIINPKLKKKGNNTALFFEGCLRSTIHIMNEHS